MWRAAAFAMLLSGRGMSLSTGGGPKPPPPPPPAPPPRRSTPYLIEVEGTPYKFVASTGLYQQTIDPNKPRW